MGRIHVTTLPRSGILERQECIQKGEEMSNLRHGKNQGNVSRSRGDVKDMGDDRILRLRDHYLWRATHYAPGTESKIDVMKRRAEHDLPIFHPEDPVILHTHFPHELEELSLRYLELDEGVAS